jgi:hypothetical protein
MITVNNRNIERLLRVVDYNVGCIHGTMDYSRITETITRLANMIADSETSEETWWIESTYLCGLEDVITGAYWHYTEWHRGQDSPEYAALCALGKVYSPNMDKPDDDNSTYMLLGDMAKEGTK